MKKFVWGLFVFSMIFVFSFGQSTVYDEYLKSLKYLGKLSANPFDSDSTSNKFGKYGSPLGNNINNPLSPYGSPFSPSGVRNSFSNSSKSPILIGEDGKYLGRINSNPFDPDSISNPFGRFGSKFSPDSVNNPFGKYGSPYSSYSATNPYTSKAPSIYDPSPPYGLPTLPKRLDKK